MTTTRIASPERVRLSVALVALVAIAALLRVLAARGDFWFDEIWSWTIATKATSVWSLLTELRHDNNHLLNSGILYLLGPDLPWFLYRLPALLAGVGSVTLAGVLAARRGPGEAWITIALFSSSYLAIHYSSEARGYAYAVFFSLLCFELMERYLHRPRPAVALLFSAAAILGMLAHLTFLHAYVALLLWSAWRAGRPARKRIEWLLCHAAPLIFGALLYIVSVRGMKIGGGTFVPAGTAALEALSLTVGGPFSGPLSVFAAIVTFGVLVAGCAMLIREQSDRWIVYAATTVILPLLFVFAGGRSDYYVRYFLIASTFLLLLLGQLLGRLARLGRPQLVASLLALGLFVTGNTIHTVRLIRLGRGEYQAAIRWMLSSGESSRVTFGSMHDFRTETTVRYYQRWIPGSDRLYYYRKSRWPARGADWFLRHTFRGDAAPPVEFQDRGGSRYHLDRTFPYAALSGWNWHLYRKQDRGHS